MNLTVKIGDRSYTVDVGDLTARPILATVEGQTFEVWPEEQHAAPAVNVPAPAAPRPAAPIAAAPISNGGDAVIIAPIPGVIIEIMVQPGVTVKVGQELCTLEAMKMKNLIRSPREGKISAVHITAGQHVKHRQVLVEFER